MGATCTEIIKKFHRETVQETTVDGEVVNVEYTICENPNCNYRWKSRVEKPKRCPKCQKDLWNWRD